MAGIRPRNLEQYDVNDVGSTGSSVAAGSDIAGFYQYHDETESETESFGRGSEDEAGATPDDEAGAAPDNSEPTVELYPGSA